MSALLLVVCIAGIVLVLHRKLPYKSTSVKDTEEVAAISHQSRFEHSSVSLSQHDDTHNGLETQADSFDEKLKHATNRLLGVGAMPTGDNDRQPLKDNQEMKNSYIVNSIVDEGAIDKEQQSDKVQSKLKNLANDLSKVEGEYHEVIQLLDSNKLISSVHKEKIVKQLEKEMKKQTQDIRSDADCPNNDSNRIHNLYVPSSMPLGPALQLEHNPRQTAVVNAIKHAWKGYKDFAWGKDELLPITKSGSNRPFGLGMTIVDCLDTLWLAGLQDEFDEARNWVTRSMNIATNKVTVSLFETNIRVLGGLLSAYHLSQDQVFLNKAVS